MSTESQIETIVKTLIQTEVVKALNNAPDAIEKLVKAALSKPVDSSGKFDSYGSNMPYLDYLVGNEIRAATTAAVRTVLAEHRAEIEQQVREGLKAESVVSAMTKAIVGAAEHDYLIKVSFETQKDRSY
jgi:hypothetical protein